MRSSWRYAAECVAVKGAMLATFLNSNNLAMQRGAASDKPFIRPALLIAQKR